MTLQAVILAGGLGTRLRQLYPDRPKGLVPILGKPFLDWQTRWLERGGVSSVHIAGGHMADKIAEWAGDLPRISVSAEPLPLGTAGGLKYVESHLRSDPFLVLNGDSLLPRLDFQGLEKAHRDSSRPVTIAVTHIDQAGRYGTVDFDSGGTLTAFKEKANHDEGWINAGIYLMDRAVLASIEPNKNLSLETDIFPALVAQRKIGVFKVDGPLLDMGTPDGIQAMESYLAAHPSA
ncbi:MAG TPA: nucleotidyltransferase family protein [Kiritimatiellia bacterium]|nr:nucleotidyltransferase family protein [Kiritimatiellia bacterium]